jgi:hypothetical protein
MASGFGQLRWMPGPAWIVEPGLRADTWNGGGVARSYLSPRLAAKRFLGARRDAAVKVAVGRYVQFVHSLRDEQLPVSNDYWVTSDDHVPAVVSDQAQLGIEKYWGERWYVSAEGYYRRYLGLTDLNTADDPNDPADDLLEGDGWSYGADFLVRRTETSSDLKIFVLDVSKEELLDDLRSASNLKDSAIAKVFIETDPDEPWALVCGNYAFEGSKDDVAGLVRAAKIAAAARAPVIAHMRPDVFGVHSIAAKPDPREWHMSTDFDAGALWATLRGIPEAKFLGMTMPRFLARVPYGADTEPLETFSFEEFADGPEHDSYVWANACFAAAALLAQSYSNYGWEMGRSMMQDLEDLPVHMYKQNGETVYQPCSEVLMTQNGAEVLMEYGLMPLVSYKNTDRVKLARFQSIADPVTGLKGRWS